MAIKVLEAEDDDMFRIFEICSLAFGNEEPFWNSSFPNHWTESGRVAGAERFKKTKNTDPAANYVKAIDDVSGEVLGMARWYIFVEHIPDHHKDQGEKKGDQSKNKEEMEYQEYQEYMSRQFFAERREVIFTSKGNVACIDIVAVDPSHQRKGVGSALVSWGVEKADSLCLEAVVESSASGKGLYEKHGFVHSKQVEIKVPEKWSQWGGQEYAWLIRAKKA